MREIEIKAKLVDRAGVMEKLKGLGCAFSEPIRQEDTVYAKFTDTLEHFLSDDVFLRIRVKNGKKIIFTLKKRLKNHLDALEHETEISSKEEIEQAILLMGYNRASRVNKERVTTEYNGCEICIDEVEGLGSFIEMEKLAEDGDGDKIQEELFQFFETLGIKREDRVREGYDILMIKAKGFDN
jgi:adenylate cyclase class 2